MATNYGRAGGNLDESSGTPPDHISYTVDITGHDEPFQWEVRRLGPGSQPVTPSDCKGESDTYEGAMLDASQAAHKAEWTRLHSSAKRTEHLFDCPLKADLGSHDGSHD